MGRWGPLRLDVRPLRSRIARRVFAVFILCALAPVTAFAVFSFQQVSAQLERDARARLRAESKSAGMAIVERLVLLELALRSIAPATQGDALAEGRFRGVWTLPDASVPGLRDARLVPRDAEERRHLGRGGSLLRVARAGAGEARLLLVRERDGQEGWLVAELDPDQVWRADALRADVSLTIRDASGGILFDSGVPEEFRGEEVLEEDWTLFLDSLFRTSDWTLSHRMPRSVVYAPLAEFSTVFPGIALASLWAVLFLSVWQIRRTFVPIEVLRDATERVAARDFDVRVAIETDDEFSTLGAAFNDMTAQIGDLTHNLEGKVEQRTRELTDALRELRETQGQLVHQEKMASLGQFVAGIAHELNNPLSFVEGNLHFLREYVENLSGAIEAWEAGSQGPERVAAIREKFDLDHVRGDLEPVLEGCGEGLRRSIRLVKDLRTFSRVDDSDVLPVDLNEALDSTLNLLSSRLLGVQVEREYAALPPVECLAGQLNQVFVNLLANAADAVDGEGKIRVATACVGADRVAVEVEDDGCGIDPETLERIFDPFYTTKPVGQGTGLGLSISYGVVERHGGRLEARSTVGTGTCMRVELPLRAQIRPVGAEDSSRSGRSAEEPEGH